MVTVRTGGGYVKTSYYVNGELKKKLVLNLYCYITTLQNFYSYIKFCILKHEACEIMNFFFLISFLHF